MGAGAALSHGRGALRHDFAGPPCRGPDPALQRDPPRQPALCALPPLHAAPRRTGDRRRPAVCRGHAARRAGPFELLPDEAYNLQHRDFDLVSRNAGPFFLLGEQIIHPTQVSTTVDYGVYLQFLARRGSSEVPLCAATPQNVEITGLAPADIIGIHTYCRDDVLEIIDARYLTRLPKIETAVETVSEAKP